MTREEAEEYAKDMTYRDAVYNALHGKCVPYRKATLIKLYELLDKLEQEPCEDVPEINVGDIISRQAVIDALTKTSGIRGDALKALYDLPPVNPQPKTGHWILTSDDDYEYCTCSECGYQNGENWMIGSQIKYCPNCGCRMVEPQESEVSDADSD